MARVVVVGLGPAGADLLTVAAVDAIAGNDIRFVRTRRHPAADAVPGATTFDDVYDGAATMDDVYRTIVDRIVTAAGQHGTVLYAVPGSPLVAERTVELLLSDGRVDVDLVPALSFVDLAWLRLGVDPVAVGARVVDGHRFDVEAAGTRGAVLVAQCDRPDVLAAVKLAVGDAIERYGDVSDGDVELIVLARLGTTDEAVLSVPWHELDRIAPDHLTSVWIPPLGLAVASELARFAELVATLRQACPWDREQTHASLRPHLLEETHEVLDALDALAAVAEIDDGILTDERLDDAYLALEEELGDLLFQVVFHAVLATEAGRFTLADVAVGIHDKLVVRHPHVFADGEATTAADVAGGWEQAKKVEKGRESVFDGIPTGLPALARAAKVVRKSRSVTGGDGLADAVEAWSVDLPPDGWGADEVGDVLLAVAARARAAGIDPESSLREAIGRYERTARALESGQ